MREIKFRAWDTVKKKYVCTGFYLLGETMLFDIFRQEYKLDELNNIEMEQYAGLKDKNGKEIYEGDIVKIHMRLNTYEEKELIFDDENCVFTFKNTYEDPHRQFSDHYEIIGNIHEPCK